MYKPFYHKDTLTHCIERKNRELPSIQLLLDKINRDICSCHDVCKEIFASDLLELDSFEIMQRCGETLLLSVQRITNIYFI